TLSMRGRCTRTGDTVTCPDASVKTRFTPAYFPAGLVTVVPSKPINCGPVQVADRFVSAKLPAPSEIVAPEHPVVLPLPSLPSIETVTPASDVSNQSDMTVRPRMVVVT